MDRYLEWVTENLKEKFRRSFWVYSENFSRRLSDILDWLNKPEMLSKDIASWRFFLTLTESLKFDDIVTWLLDQIKERIESLQESKIWRKWKNIKPVEITDNDRWGATIWDYSISLVWKGQNYSQLNYTINVRINDINTELQLTQWEYHLLQELSWADDNAVEIQNWTSRYSQFITLRNKLSNFWWLVEIINKKRKNRPNILIEIKEYEKWEANIWGFNITLAWKVKKRRYIYYWIQINMSEDQIQLTESEYRLLQKLIWADDDSIEIPSGVFNYDQFITLRNKLSNFWWLVEIIDIKRRRRKTRAIEKIPIWDQNKRPSDLTTLNNATQKKEIDWFCFIETNWKYQVYQWDKLLWKVLMSAQDLERLPKLATINKHLNWILNSVWLELKREWEWEEARITIKRKKNSD